MSVQSTLSSVIGPEAPARVDGGGEYLSRNPANLEDVVAQVSLGGPDVLPAATEQARRAQREWAQVPAPVRGRVVAGLGRLVEANKESLARLVTREIGKPDRKSVV